MPVDHSQDSTASSARPVGVARILAFVAIVIGCVLNSLNGAMAVTAYPVMSEYFQIPYANMSAMVMLFMATTALAQPLAGGLGDFLGRKNIFLMGIGVFMIASYLAANAQSFNMLLVWRVMQAASSGIMMANGMAMVSLVAPPDRVGSYLGWLNSAFTASTVAGFSLGGLLLQFYDWRVLFLLNIPLGMVAFVLAFFLVPKSQSRAAHFTALSFIGLPVLPLAFCLQAWVRQESPVIPLCVFLVTLFIVVYAVLNSSKSKTQLKTFGDFRFYNGCFIMLFSIAMHFVVMFTIPAWSSAALQIDSAVMGLYFSLIAGTNVFLAPIFGRMLDRGKVKFVSLVACLAFVTSLAILVFMLNRLSFGIALSLIGCALASTQVLAQRKAIQSSSEDSRALAMGVFNSFRSVGGLSGNAVAAVILSGYVLITAQAGVKVFEVSFWVFIIPLTLSIAVSLLPMSRSGVKQAQP